MKNTFVSLLLVFVLFSCKNNQEVKVGFLLPNFTDARYLKDRDFFVAKFKSLGGTVEIGNAENDAQKQEDQAKGMITNGAKILVITVVNQNSAATIVRMANSSGVKVIAYERLIRNSDIDYFISFDHYKVGEIQAKYALKYKPSGNYVILSGDKRDNNAELIMNGQMNAINTAGNSAGIKVVYKSFVEDWSEDGAYFEMRRVLRLFNDKIDVVLTANDGMAGGVLKALDEFQPGYPVIVTGLDADINACRRIVAGKQSMTVYKSFKVQAEMAAAIAFKIIKGDNITEAKDFTDNGLKKVPSISLVGVGVDKSNISSTIIADHFYTEQLLKE